MTDEQIVKLKATIEKQQDLLGKYDLWQVKASSLYLQARRAASTAKAWIESEDRKTSEAEVAKLVSDMLSKADKEMDDLLDQIKSMWDQCKEVIQHADAG